MIPVGSRSRGFLSSRYTPMFPSIYVSRAGPVRVPNPPASVFGERARRPSGLRHPGRGGVGALGFSPEVAPAPYRKQVDCC